MKNYYDKSKLRGWLNGNKHAMRRRELGIVRQHVEANRTSVAATATPLSWAGQAKTQRWWVTLGRFAADDEWHLVCLAHGCHTPWPSPWPNATKNWQ